ncbi:hypothetical protein [Noviherbaspirillum denitrificans]|uniref:Uncharacterized protein n=1 Tax=Noviherbaspirillum denitrificans TaxID=1968433 RepID=A0A254TIW0_9BURK|nr:hypothetical protein [Noviherbaspirillum denitrificans]OWW20503.1 hypothetical protein AYR66_14415 [Noviherbaspirillum denitrificans]
MKWFYEWRLKRIRAEMAMLESATKIRLQDDYTGHSRLRVLQKVENNLLKRLGRYDTAPPGKELAEAPADLKQTT